MKKFWCGYVKSKYREKAKLCYMDTDSFITYIKRKIFLQILRQILKQDIILQIMNQTDHYLKEKTYKEKNRD